MKSINILVVSLIVAVASVIILAVPSTAIAACTGGGLSIPTCDDISVDGKTTDLSKNPIVLWINFFINLISVTIVAGASLMIAIAGVQYTTSRDNPQAVQAAKQKIWNVLIGLLAFFFLFAFLQWIIPGGVF